MSKMNMNYYVWHAREELTSVYRTSVMSINYLLSTFVSMLNNPVERNCV